MIALCVDNDVRALNNLQQALDASPNIYETVSFETQKAALEWSGSHVPDVAFLGILMGEDNGLELGKQLREMHPQLPIVFCTKHPEYAMDAFQIHATGYLRKPIRPEDVQRELDHIRSLGAAPPLLHAHCFGTFAIYADGKPLHFKRAKSQELLAYLIDRRGASVTARELYTLLFEDRLDEKSGLNSVHQAVSDIRRTLKSVGAEEVLISRARGYSLDTTRIDCDYYRLLEGDRNASRRFTGEYMSNYSWSHYTCAYLESHFLYGHE